MKNKKRKTRRRAPPENDGARPGPAPRALAAAAAQVQAHRFRVEVCLDPRRGAPVRRRVRGRPLPGLVAAAQGHGEADTNPFSTNALAATSIEQQVKSDKAGAAAALTLGQDTKSSKKAIGKAVKSAVAPVG